MQISFSRLQSPLRYLHNFLLAVDQQKKFSAIEFL